MDNLLGTRRGRLLTFGLLYISEGIPYGFTSTAMVAFMRKEGLSLEQIGTFVAALFLPWALKWAWAPLIDLIKLPRLGGRKGWIVFCTGMMILTLVVAALVDFVAQFQLLLWVIVLNNLFCATQDVAIDSLAVSTLKPDELGTANGIMFGGQALGIALGGGGAIFVFGYWGINAALFYVSLLLLLNLLFVVFFVRDPFVVLTAERRATLSEFAKTLRGFLMTLWSSFMQSGRGPRVGLLFAVLPMGSLALGYAILGTIEVDYGLSTNQIAELSIYNTIAMAVGCVVGGRMGDQFGLRKTIAVCFLLTTVPTVLLAMQIASVGLAGINPELFYSLIISHGLLLGTCAGLQAGLFMGMTNPVVAATQFTAFMALSNLAISIANYWQGIVADQYGYAVVLYLDALLVLLPLALIPFLQTRYETLALYPENAAQPQAV